MHICLDVWQQPLHLRYCPAVLKQPLSQNYRIKLIDITNGPVMDVMLKGIIIQSRIIELRVILAALYSQLMNKKTHHCVCGS